MRLIDADALMETIRAHDYPLRSHFNSTDNGMFTIGIQQAVDEQPTVDAVVVKHGKWINLDTLEDSGDCAFMCSICGEMYWSEDSNLVSPNDAKYCPNCGAEMSFDEV